MRVLQARTKRPLDLLTVGAGGRVAAASSAFGVRGDVDVWDIATGKFIFTHPGGSREVSAIAVTPDGKHLLVGEEESITALHLSAKTVVASRETTLSLPQFALSPDGTRLLVTGSTSENGGIEFFTVASVLSVHKLWSQTAHSFLHFSDPAISPDGRRVAVSRHDGFRDRVSNVVEIRDAAKGKVQAEIEFGASDPLEEIVFSADGSKVLARSSGRTVKVFDAATGQPAGELLHPGRPYVTGVAVHPTGTVACSRNNGTVCLWDLDKRELGRTLDWKLGKLVSVAFSPDGSIGAAGTEDGQVVVWDVD